MNRYLHITIKMSIASFVTIIVTELLGLEYAITAGILAVLSIQLTRKDSIILAGKRLLDAVLAIALFTLLYVLFGYSVIVFAIGTVLFIGLSFALKIDVGIVPALVLSSHILLEGRYSFDVIVNSFLLIFIASVVALFLNLIYPLNVKKALYDITEEIDQYIKDDLSQLVNCMSHIPHISSSLASHELIHQKLEKTLYKAELNDKDLLFDQNHQHMSYIHMRNSQMKRIHQIYELMMLIENTHPHIDILTEYINDLVQDIGKDDMASAQMIKLNTILYEFKQSNLPTSRDEFETRAVLYQMVFELEAFLEEKIAYHNKYTNL